MALQTSQQTMQTSVPPDAYGVDPSSSRRHYIQQTSPSVDAYRSNNSPQSSRRPSRRPSGNTAQSSNTGTSQYRSPAVSQPPSTEYSQAINSTLYQSPNTQTTSTSPPYPTIRRDQRTEQELYGGPPIAPPPRTSSNQRELGTTASASVPLADRTVPVTPITKSQVGQGTSARSATNSEVRQREDALGGKPTGESNRVDRPGHDSTSTAAAAAVARRRGPTSPEGPQTSTSTRETRAQLSPGRGQSRSATNVGMATPPTKTSQEGTNVLNRIILTDPQIDISREKERLAEGIPLTPDNGTISSLGAGGNDTTEETGRSAGRSRQDHSASAARRKETKFGEYMLGQTLGEGEFGKVKLGWKKDGSVQVAIKLIRRENLNTNPSRLPKIYREIKILSQLSHPNIVRLHEMVETDRYIGIILEYASGGELFDYILTHRYLKDNAARKLFAQLVSGVGYLHKKGIVHRDLKLENLLLDRNRNIIITDFGFANTFNPRDELGDDIEYNLTNRDFVKKMDLERLNDDGFRRGDLMQTSCGSPCYAAPELVVTDSLYTGRKVDVWSCGVILYAMLAGYLPFDDDPANPEGDNINLLYKYIMSTPLTFPEYVTPHARDLLRRILVPDPRKRADLFEVARHSWLSDYAHVVAHVTSSTTTVGEIANTTVTSVHADAPLLARSASVREPTKPHISNMSPVGGLSHQGKIDPEQADKSKSPRDPKRRTVQVEYVAPQSQTVRGEMSPLPIQQPAALGSPLPISGNERARSGNQGSLEQSRMVSAALSARKPLPQDPPTSPDPRTFQEPQATASRSGQRPVTSQSTMQPPARPARDPPRSVSDSMNAFGQLPSTSIARPATGGSMASTTGGRLPSRGNSYSQPLAPVLAATNAHGGLAQPKNGRQYNISAPIPQDEPYYQDPSIGLSSAQRTTSRYSQAPPRRQEAKTHKRSNTLGNVFGRSASFFSGKSQPQSPSEEVRQQPEKRYPPTSMKAPIASDSPRQSTDSRRPSFGFGRKNSDLSRADKPRRFSLLPASFSFKGLTGGTKDSSYESSRPISQRKQSVGQQQDPRNLGFARRESRTNSEDSVPIYDDEIDRFSRVAMQTSLPEDSTRNARKTDVPQESAHQRARYTTQQASMQNGPLPPGQSYYITASGARTDSEMSISQPPNRMRYPQGFNSYDDEPRPSMQQGRNGRGPGVLQKPNRKFADAYDQDNGYHAGSSGAAKRVMDFFRRRGKARAGDDR